METGVSTLAKQTFGILVVDDERTLRFTLKEGLSEEGYRVETAADCAEALEKVGRDEFHLALLDQKLPDGNGIDLLKKIRSMRRGIQVVMMTAFGKFEQAVEATKAGCFEYVAKPFELDHMKLIIQNALSQSRLAEEVGRLRDVERRHAGSMLIVGGSSKLIRIIETIRKIAQTGTSTVMLQGETGVGKELLAREIHDQGPRRDGPFVEVNCSAFPENLLEMELFGFERGVFTDAKAMKKGLMELANSGTLFLDEIGEMSLSLQTKLLRALEMKRFRRVGGLADIHVETRIVTATNRDLRAMVEQGKFREDLFFRLDVIRVVVPPLRERPEDIPPLIDHFIAHWNQEFGRSVKGPTDEALQLLLAYRWPGNVRELRNVLERAILLESEEWILPEHLPVDLVSAGGSGPRVLETRLHAEGGVTTLAQAERIAIEMALAKASGNKTRAAEALGISRQTLRTKLKEYRIEAPAVHAS
ncbi:MAG: sigma-54-dependent Fis family transcriptional regulator [Candidatus Eisenbacteria bacterium]|uniref:Sigma-54-dependent Fis family transcriptional regulator n=1 Tax=Eiseniibacteriota bacterium TaxID=2212470 RepID=A0A538TMD4_UNCEI|nr:MAG: sigma-54-dependent Fis family transcriptional regulator [Candidatus Eisenbacteria bacterium]